MLCSVEVNSFPLGVLLLLQPHLARSLVTAQPMLHPCCALHTAFCLLAHSSFKCRAEGQQQYSSSLSVDQTPAHAAAADQITQSSARAVAAFILRCLTLLPTPLAGPLGEPLLLQPLYRLIGSTTAAQEYLLDIASVAAAEAATSGALGVPTVQPDNSVRNTSQSIALHGAVPYSAELALLHIMGWELGVAAWQDDWRARCAAETCTGGKADGTPAAGATGGDQVIV